MYDDLLQKKKKLAVIGLGYVGLPLALAFAEKLSVIGYDIDSKKVGQLKEGSDPSRAVGQEAFKHKDIVFSCDAGSLQEAHFFIVAVPTPVDHHKAPDLQPLLLASEAIGRVLKKGDYVVFESTVYPGCTEEECLPVLEQHSGLQCPGDFKLGYSPERINPGDKNHTLANTVKVVAACDPLSLEETARLYELVVTAGVHKAPGIKVAETGKMLENTQRYVNISLMNEMAMICDRLGINTLDVLEAAGTKWNFAKFNPGLVGGHCIGVDPYYLKHKARQLGYHAQVLASGELVNDEMPYYVSKKVLQHIIKAGTHPQEARVLVLGITFKENVSDIRNSKVIPLVKDLMDYAVQVDVMDNYADAHEVWEQHGIRLLEKAGSGYDAVVLAVAHDAYRHFSEEGLLHSCKQGAMFADLKGHYRGKFSTLVYWNL
ncbi:MAG: nucleotide sugar dehydrogenase [Williamsia sp.]|nr:nucleotide sugar dehydrogenase [Williamsia sp.]